MYEQKLLLIASAALLCALFMGSASGAATTTAKAAVTAAKNGTTAKAAATTAAPGNATAKANGTTAAGKAATNSTVSSTSVPTTATKFVPFPESQCFFPFWHNHTWHHTCIKYNDFGDFWCSLTQNFTKDENWRRCRKPDLKRFQCHIPFEYRGKKHSRCLPIETGAAADAGAHHGFWCAVVPKIGSWSAGSTDFAYCENENATGVAYLKAVGVHKDLPAAAAGKGKGGTGAMAVAAGAPAKSLSGGASGSGASGAAGLGAQATVGIAVGTVCAVLAIVAVVAGVAIRRRRRKGCDHKALLETKEKGTYGGMEASD